MNPGLFKLLLLFCISFTPFFTWAQEEEPQTIKVRRESNLSKAVFDNTEFKLMVIDRFGNPRENKIVSYKLWIRGKGATTALDGYSNSLTPDMIGALKKQKKAVKIFFTEISVQEDDGHLVKLPDVIDTWFPDCENCEQRPAKRKTW
jgi:hypothetical protein